MATSTEEFAGIRVPTSSSCWLSNSLSLGSDVSLVDVSFFLSRGFLRVQTRLAVSIALGLLSLPQAKARPTETFVFTPSHGIETKLLCEGLPSTFRLANQMEYSRKC